MKDNNEWSGPQDGLPPVGTECEIDTRFGWLPGRIVDHGDDYAVSHLHENKHNLKVDWSRTGFRPIQSERDKATYELARDLGDICPMPEVVNKVIDLGYRKPMSREKAIYNIQRLVPDLDTAQAMAIADMLGHED